MPHRALIWKANLYSFLSGEQSAPRTGGGARQSGVIRVPLTPSAPQLTFPEINLLEAGNGVRRSFHGCGNCKERCFFL